MITIATKSIFSDTRQPNFLYGKGLLTTHSDEQHNGRLYATCEHYVNGVPNFPIFESIDHGQSWQHISDVSDQVNGWGMRYQPFLYELPEKIGNLPMGTLICAGNSIPKDMSATKIDLYKSVDHGQSWQYLSTVVQGGTASVKDQKPVWEPFLIVINHQLVCFFSDERDKKAHSQKLSHKLSRDGRHWGAEIDDVAVSNPEARPGMATVARMANGNYIMTFEMVAEGAIVVNGERNRSNFKISQNGLDWQPTDPGTEFANGGSPYVTVLSDGRVVANSTGNELYVNDKNGDGKWATVQTPMAGAYSRSLTPLGNSQVLIVSAGPYAGPTAKADHELTSLIFKIPTD